MSWKKCIGFVFACLCAANHAYSQFNWTDAWSSALPRASTPSFSSSSPLWGNSPSLPGGTASGGFVSARRDWKIGVGIQNTETGALVTTVATGSAAQQASIFAGDTIVAAGPARLGIVDGRIVELADELKRSADSFGRIGLLVMDSRSRTLRSVVVNLMSSASAVSGTMAIRDPLNLPQGSTLVVELKNVSQTYFEIAGGKSVTNVQGFGPFTFELSVDPRFISPNDQYELMAGVFVGNQPAYTLSQPVRLTAASMTQPLSLTLERSGTGFGTSFPSVSAAYPSMGGNDPITQMFMQIIGKPPSAAELVGWQGYLSQGRSIDDLRLALLSSNKYRERFRGDEAVYMQNLIRELTNRTPTQQELSYWLGRLQATGATQDVAREIMQQRR